MWLVFFIDFLVDINKLTRVDLVVFQSNGLMFTKRFKKASETSEILDDAEANVDETEKLQVIL